MTLLPFQAALRTLATLSALVALLLPTHTRAGDGHDHGPAQATAHGPALPRFSAVSESFELVGVLQGRQLTLYLDRAADNTPVTGASIELDMAGTKHQARAHDDVYEVTLATAPAPGVWPVTATVTAGTEADLLAAELDVHTPAPQAATAVPAWRSGAAWSSRALAVPLVLAVLGALLMAHRWTARRRAAKAAKAALVAPAVLPALLLGLALPLPTPSWAGAGHDHGDTAPTPAANGPQRLPDGSVFLPKPAQRQLGVRTVLTEAGDWPRAFELNGKVVMDPNAGGQVQPLNSGRIEPGPRGLPALGQAVRRGEVLAYVVPTLAPTEAANQRAQLAEWRAAQALAEQRVARLKDLADTVPRKDIEAADSEARSLAARVAALSAGLATREALLAPVSGVIASAQVVAGQVVDARERVFEIVDPQRLRIEALAFDPAVAATVGGASLALGAERVPLRLVGTARRLREQALPLVFQAEGRALAALAVDQPVRVVVQSRERVAGIAVPVAALLRNAANQAIVWVKTAPERFEPRPVTVAPLDGVQVVVSSGLQPGDRVATQGATLINQVR